MSEPVFSLTARIDEVLESDLHSWSHRDRCDCIDCTTVRGARAALAELAGRAELLAALLEQAVEHMEFAHYPQHGDGTHLVDPIKLIKESRATLSASTPKTGDDEPPPWTTLHDGVLDEAARREAARRASSSRSDPGQNKP